MLAQYLYHGGDDLSVVNAAKVSFARASTEVGEAEKSLINFLARGMSSKDWEKKCLQIGHSLRVSDTERFVQEMRMMATHWTPFAHNSITLRVSAPLPVRTQCFKHKVGFVENEESRRYISTRPVLFVPPFFRSKADSAKQGSGGKHGSSDYWRTVYIHQCGRMINMYEDMIAAGVCPEQARFVLPQGVEVCWIWTGNLASYARYFNQRTDPHAQKESQVLAHQIGKLIAPLFPVSWKALTRPVD